MKASIRSTAKFRDYRKKKKKKKKKKKTTRTVTKS